MADANAISIAQLARLSGLTDRRLRELASEGWFPKAVEGRYDLVPAGDLNLLKLVGRLATGSPHARATEDEVRAFFAPYEEWGGLAAMHAGGAVRGREEVYTPSPGRNSFVRARAASGGVRTSRLAAIQFP